MGAKNDFNQLFKDFQADEFFQDALYALSWDEVVVGPINRVSGSSSSTTTTYNAMAFLVNPSKSERPSASVFKDIQVGDIAISVRQEELVKEPPLNSVVTFDGAEYSCKEIVSDPAKVTWKLLLRK